MRVIVWVFGIIIPFITIGFEAANHLQANVYRDPMPTWLHFFILLAVPGSYLVVDLLHRRGIASWGMGLLLLANGFALTVSAIYLLVYLPFMPLAVFAIILMGLGLLGLTPLWCGIAGIVQFCSLVLYRSERGTGRLPGVCYTLGGVALAVLLLGLPEVHMFLIDRGISQAFSGSPNDQTKGLRLLRTIGGQDEVLRRCYNVVPERGWHSFGDSDGPGGITETGQKYRVLYYRLTGRPFNSEPRPARRELRFRSRAQSDDTWEDFGIADSEIGGTAVAGRVRGLQLDSSTIDGTIEANPDGTAGPWIAYLEWTMEFRNQSSVQREARAQITLPSGAVASRLTLWINGQERPAAYGKRAQVTEAYRQVAVRERRDPALLNAVGPDRVLLQCFPIPPGRTLKTKVGITVPLIFRDGQAHLQLPHVSERNFTISPELKHNVWVDSQARVETHCAALAVTQTSKAIQVRGALSDKQLQDPTEGVLSLAARIDKPLHYVASLGDRQASMELTPESPSTAPSTVCLVIDGSATMAGPIAEVDWVSVARALPAADTKVNVIFASDRPVQWRRDWGTPADAIAGLQKWLASQSFVGGCGPEEALEMAWDLCAQRGGGLIMWVHGPLPVALSSSGGLKQRFRRRPGGKPGNPVLVGVQGLPGPHRLVEDLGDIEGFRRLPVLLSLQQTLEYAVSAMASAGPVRMFQLTDGMGSSHPVEGAREASGHLVRLAAFERVLTACRSQKVDQSVTELAVEMQLVTPLSGAVVLETKAQYERNELAPSGAETQPVVPEPTILVLLALGGLTLLRRRRQGHQQRCSSAGGAAGPPADLELQRHADVYT